MAIKNCLTADGVHRPARRVNDMSLSATEPESSLFIEVANITHAMPSGTARLARAHRACSKSVDMGNVSQIMTLQMATPRHQMANLAAGHTDHDLVHDF